MCKDSNYSKCFGNQGLCFVEERGRSGPDLSALPFPAALLGPLLQAPLPAVVVLLLVFAYCQLNWDDELHHPSTANASLSVAKWLTLEPVGGNWYF